MKAWCTLLASLFCFNESNKVLMARGEPQRERTKMVRVRMGVRVRVTVRVKERIALMDA